MKSVDICPICKKDFRGQSKSSTKLKQHISKKEDPFHQLLKRHQARWPAAPYFISMMEIKPQFDKLVEQYGPPKHYTEEHVIHEDDPFLETTDDWDDL